MAGREESSNPESTLRIQRVFDAPREKVFRAFTDPEELKLWFGPNDDITVPVVEVDLRAGGRYRIDLKTPDGSV
ncbi:MAG: SRPBCC family protein, partial [Candidatus Binatia bacterium]